MADIQDDERQLGDPADEERLAIDGGTPALDHWLKPRVHIDDDTKARIDALIQDGLYSDFYGGPACHEFEREFAAFHGDSLFCVATNSGTSALHLAYAAAELEAGAEIIVPAAGYISACSAAIQVGLVPVVCDVDPVTFTTDIESLEARITARTQAIAPVHFWGCPSDMSRIMDVADRHGLMVIEDCGQAHGARADGRRVGTFGELACYSFAPRKHVSIGQGGMVMTRSEQRARRMRSLANKGKGTGWFDYQSLGYSYVLADFEALLGLDGLRKLDQEIAARRAAAAVYREVFEGTELTCADDPPWGEHVFFKLAVSVPPGFEHTLDFIVEALPAENVNCRPTHPPMSTIPWLREFMEAHGVDSGDDTVPNAMRALPRIFELDTGPGISLDDAERSARATLKVWRAAKAR